MDEKKLEPKYKIGQSVFAHWAGGHTTKHVIKDIKNTYHGFWYSWEDATDNCGNGLHENYLTLY